MKIIRHNSRIASFLFENVMTVPKFNLETGRFTKTMDANAYVLSEIFRLASEGWKIKIISEMGKIAKDQAFPRKVIEKFIERFELPSEVVVAQSAGFRKYLIPNFPSSLHFDYDRELLEQLPSHVTGVRIPYPNEVEYPIFPWLI